jgi:RecA-superfamily ATPases implicated in signal transduction
VGQTSLVRLGVAGLDEALGGGVPRGSIILLAGYPGAGKTTLATQFAYEGVRNGERALYVSFVEPKEDFYRNSANFGINLAEAESKGLFKYYEALNVSTPEALSDLIEDLLIQVDSMGASRAVVDSVSAVEQLAGDAARVREVLHSAFYVGLKKRGVTSILVAELPFGGQTVGLGPEEFIADGVIIMRYRYVKGKMERYAEIRKMRGSPVLMPYLPYAITQRGVVFPPAVEFSTLPSGIRPRRFYRVFGVDVVEGSGVLIAYDPALDPLWLSVGLLAAPAAKAGLKVKYCSYIHGYASVRHALEACLGPAELERVLIAPHDPSRLTAAGAELWAYETDVSFGPQIVIDEGVHLMAEFFSRLDYMGFAYRTLVRRAATYITNFQLYAAPIQRVWDVPLSNYYDYVLYAYPTEDGIGIDVLRAWGQPGPSKRPVKSLRVKAEELSCGSELGLRPEDPQNAGGR